MEDRPWASWGKSGKGMNQNQLARQLKDFKVYPQTIRMEQSTPKGYRREWFEDVWNRYIPTSVPQTATPTQPAYSLDETQLSNRHTDSNVALSKC